MLNLCPSITIRAQPTFLYIQAVCSTSENEFLNPLYTTFFSVSEISQLCAYFNSCGFVNVPQNCPKTVAPAQKALPQPLQTDPDAGPKPLLLYQSGGTPKLPRHPQKPQCWASQTTPSTTKSSSGRKQPQLGGQSKELRSGLMNKGKNGLQAGVPKFFSTPQSQTSIQQEFNFTSRVGYWFIYG